MNSTTTEKTIEKLRRVFASYGLPDEVVTDNGPQFTAKDFTEFLRKNGVRHTRTPPYRNMPTTTTGRTPGELFLSWTPRTRLTMLQPDLERRMEERFCKVKGESDENRGSWRAYKEGESVLVQGLRPGEPKWLLGVIEKRCSAVTYIVRVGPGNRFVHVDSLRSRHFESDEQGPSEPPCFVPSSITDPMPEVSPTRPRFPVLEPPSSEPPEDSAPSGQRNASPRQDSAPASPLQEPASPQGAQTLRRSTRARNPPDLYRP
ncbi:hypothetical protein MTO96_041315 [Rhipicephalus appendiculatus]